MDADSDVSFSALCSWRLVWCNERCHKAENAERRRILSEKLRAAGASLVCLKKANRFAMWLTKAQRPPYILLTDWREVKPCLQAASREQVTNQPVFAIVLCEEATRHGHRASMWAQKLPPRIDPVHVVTDLGFLLGFLGKLGDRVQASSTTDPLSHLAKVQKIGLYPQEFLYAQLMDAQSSAGTTVPVTPAPLPENVRAPAAGGHGCGWLPLLATTPLLAVPLERTCAAAGEGASSGGKVAQMLACVCLLSSPNEVEQLLLTAMPETYDD